MIPRALSRKLKQAAKQFPVVTLTGPRQSGKTTLVKHLFPSKPYVSLEDPDTRDFALSDPRAFLKKYESGAVFDEIQRTPELFSYLQGVVDREGKKGLFILTGSQHFLLLERIAQTLAGRVSLLKLLPFSLEEIRPASLRPKSPEEAMFKGFYPRIYADGIPPRDWYPAYIQTYLERDVRLMKNVGDLHTFQRFLKMCAARTGQLLNLSSLASDCGITHNTAKSWVGVLEASFIVYLLPPYHRNFNKRLIKTPKLYFYDPGLVSSLLGIEDKKQLETHPLRGSIFETMVMTELVKSRFNQGLAPNLYFWRDKTGNEVDCLIEKGSNRILPVEIKSGQTITHDCFKGLQHWFKISRTPKKNAFVVYSGEERQERDLATVVGWREIDLIGAGAIKL